MFLFSFLQHTYHLWNFLFFTFLPLLDSSLSVNAGKIFSYACTGGCFRKNSKVFELILKLRIVYLNFSLGPTQPWPHIGDLFCLTIMVFLGGLSSSHFSSLSAFKDHPSLKTYDLCLLLKQGTASNTSFSVIFSILTLKMTIRNPNYHKAPSHHIQFLEGNFSKFHPLQTSQKIFLLFSSHFFWMA